VQRPERLEDFLEESNWFGCLRLSTVESLLRLMVESWLLTELVAHTPAALFLLAAPRKSLAISLARQPLEIAVSPQTFSAARVGFGS
jgi:hypothetical protein